MPTRRELLRCLACGAVASLAPPIRLAFAAAPIEQRFVLVLLRGALDGLAAVPPYGDPAYESQRQSLAVAPPGDGEGAFDLDGFFGLHPALTTLHGLYAQRQLIVLHAVATPYRERSHFDGQDLLDNGTARPHGAGDGWLNRALGLLGGEGRLGLAVGPSVPLALRGDAPVASWSPQFLPALEEDFVARLQSLYARDPVLGPRFAEALAARAMSDDIVGDEAVAKSRLRGAEAVRLAAAHVGALMADARGPRVAAVEVGGWDTHAGQGVLTGRLASQLAALDAGIAALRDALGPAWRHTAVAVVTEFGRTVAPNGTNGTDHGTGGVAFLAGGAVAGGRVVADWPGLAAGRLYQGRDLQPTADLRSLFKAVLIGHLGLPQAAAAGAVLPDSAAALPLADAILG